MTYRIRTLLTALDRIDIDLEKSILMTNVHINSDRYWFSSYDNSLNRNMEEIS